jgi:hypothetical protein
MQSQLYPFASMGRANEPDAPRSPYKPGNGLEPPYLADRGAQLDRFGEFLADASTPGENASYRRRRDRPRRSDPHRARLGSDNQFLQREASAGWGLDVAAPTSLANNCRCCAFCSRSQPSTPPPIAGVACSHSAAIPATCGVAILVPLIVCCCGSSQLERTLRPGAAISTYPPDHPAGSGRRKRSETPAGLDRARPQPESMGNWPGDRPAQSEWVDCSRCRPRR